MKQYRPRIHKQTLDEMAAGRRRSASTALVTYSPLDRATEWLTEKFPKLVTIDAQLVLTGKAETEWMVLIRVERPDGQQIKLAENVLEFPTDALIAQLMLVSP